VEIYHTPSTLEAHKILDVILRPEGIEGVMHDRVDHAFPAPAAQGGMVSVAVPLDRQADALRLVEEARENGYLAPEGEVVYPAPVEAD
jgi:hypothetical protein